MLSVTLLAVKLDKNKYSACLASPWWPIELGIAGPNPKNLKAQTNRLIRNWNTDDDKCPKKIISKKQLHKIKGCYKVVLEKNKKPMLLPKKYIHNGELTDEQFNNLTYKP